jgi:hypothetical protein
MKPGEVLIKVQIVSGKSAILWLKVFRLIYIGMNNQTYISEFECFER